MMNSNVRISKYNHVFLSIFSILFLLTAKSGFNSDSNLLLVSSIMMVSVIVLAYLSAPCATALVFMSHNLVGQITMSHPGVLVQIIPAGALLISLLYKRLDEIKYFLTKRKIVRAESWALLAIIAVFIFGFLNAFLRRADISFLTSVEEIFKASHGGSIDFYPYVFMSRWGIFILIGSLCCRGKKELKEFFFYFAIFVTAQLIAVPFGTYSNSFRDICTGFTGTGLQALNVNRSYLGYLIAISSYSFLGFASYEKQIKRRLGYYLLGLVFMLLCVLSGSKGAYLALILAVLFLAIRGGKSVAIRTFTAISLLVIVSLAVTLPMGCQKSYRYFTRSFQATSGSSVSIRVDLAKEVLVQSQNSTKHINFFFFDRFFGSGLGASVVQIPVTFLDMFNRPLTVMQGSGSHNLFIDFFADLGIIGLFIFVVSIYILTSRFFKNISPSSDNNLLKTLMGGVLIILLVYSIIATAPSMATIQALFVGILFGVGIKTNSTSESVI